jgi:hypothetical protein
MRETEKVTPEQLYALLERQQFRCALTGRPLSPEEAELDHRVSRADGGDDGIDNLQWIEATVNRAKGTMGTAAFIGLCRAVVRQADAKKAGETNGPSEASGRNPNDYMDTASENKGHNET